MSKLEYFFLCIARNMYMNRKWILRGFAIKRNSVVDEPFIPSFEDGKCFFVDEGGSRYDISDYEQGMPLFPLTDTVTVGNETFPVFDSPQKTSFGNVVVGSCIFQWALEGKVEFYNPQKPISISDLDDIVSEAIKAKVISIEPHYKNYIKALDFCTVFTDFITPVGHKEMFIPNKETLAKRDELVKKYEGQLHIPAIAAKVEEEINKSDRSVLKDSPAMGFLGTSKKLINTVRKKQNYAQGLSVNTKDPSRVDFIGTSLNDGWKTKDLPTMINGIRSGSYSRGQLTALGGVATKQLQRALSNAKVESDDCGTKVGVPIYIGKHNIGRLTGYYDATTGKPLDLKVGTTKYVRNPGTCKEPNGKFCKKCVGDRVAQSGTSLGSLAITFTGNLLGVFLSAFHSVDLTLQPLDFEERLK